MMTSDNLAYFSDLVKRRSGLSLSLRKSDFIETRLKPLTWRRGFRNTSELLAEIRRGEHSDLAREAIAAMAIHDTAFFRDEAAFACLRDAVIPELMASRKSARKLRIWSAAAAFGQEAYSLAMMLAEMPQLTGWDVSILASDMDANVIAQAEEGLYSEFDVQRGLSMTMLAKYFRPEKRGWRVAPQIRERVEFSVVNLLDGFDELGTFDLVLCRNVLIFFDGAIKNNVLMRLGGAMAEDAVLVLGAAETLAAMGGNFAAVPQTRGIYARQLAPRALEVA